MNKHTHPRWSGNKTLFHYSKFLFFVLYFRFWFDCISLSYPLCRQSFFVFTSSIAMFRAAYYHTNTNTQNIHQTPRFMEACFSHGIKKVYSFFLTIQTFCLTIIYTSQLYLSFLKLKGLHLPNHCLFPPWFLSNSNDIFIS